MDIQQNIRIKGCMHTCILHSSLAITIFLRIVLDSNWRRLCHVYSSPSSTLPVPVNPQISVCNKIAITSPPPWNDCSSRARSSIPSLPAEPSSHSRSENIAPRQTPVHLFSGATRDFLGKEFHILKHVDKGVEHVPISDVLNPVFSSQVRALG